MIEVAAGGVVLLGVLGRLIGLRIDQESRDAAWARIATARRTNSDGRRELEMRELALAVRIDELDLRERRVDMQEVHLMQRAAILAEYEKQLGAAVG